MAQRKFEKSPSSAGSCMTDLHVPADSGGTTPFVERDYIGSLAEESSVTAEIDFTIEVSENNNSIHRHNDYDNKDDDDDNNYSNRGGEGGQLLQQQREHISPRTEDTDLHLGLGPPRSSPPTRPLINITAATTTYVSSQSLNPLPPTCNPTPSTLPPPTIQQHPSKSGGTKRSYAEAMSGPPMRTGVPKPEGSALYKFGGGGYAFEGPTARSSRVPQKPMSPDLSLGEVGQVVGWPPVRSFRKHTLVVNPKPSGEEEQSLYVKVNMDGIPIGRKLDLNAFKGYQELQYAIEEMFQPSVNSHEPPSTHFRFCSKSEYALTYEDKDGDWMLVGDVPWDMFVNTVRRLRVMKDGGDS